MNVAVITANLGKFDKNNVHEQQSVECDFFHFTDENFPRRSGSMTPRLQARIVKMFGWQMAPGYDYYIWVDSSCSLSHPDAVKWLLEQCDGVHLALFKHPHRTTIHEEADYLKERLKMGCSYITPRYWGELLDEQLAEIDSDKGFVDDKLFASTIMVYRNDGRVRNLMKEWWYHTSRYHSIDQLSLPYVVMNSRCSVRVIPDNYLKIPYVTYTRNK